MTAQNTPPSVAWITPTIEDARRMGQNGARHDEHERQLYEAYCKGHCWAVGPWVDNGDGEPYYYEMRDRVLFAMWRDRGALAMEMAQRHLSVQTQTQDPIAGSLPINLAKVEAFEEWAKGHDYICLDRRPKDELMVNGLFLSRYSDRASELAWRAWANRWFIADKLSMAGHEGEALIILFMLWAKDHGGIDLTPVGVDSVCEHELELPTFTSRETEIAYRSFSRSCPAPQPSAKPRPA